MNAIARNGLAVLMTAALTAGTIQSARAVNLQDGLVSYWPLDEGSGTDALDAGGPASFVADNGTLMASPAWISGQFNAGLQFNGVDQHVLVPASTDMDLNSSGVTLSAWVKLDQLPADLTPGFGGIFDSQDDQYVMYLDRGNNELRFKVTAGSAAERPGVPAKMLDTSDWHHVMGSFDSNSGSNKIYFDGQLVDVHSIVEFQGQVVNAGQVSAIGGQVTVDPPNTVSNAFPGAISDVAVWNRSLGLAEAQYLYNSGTGNAVGAANPNINPLPISPVKPTAQPVVYYNFDNNLDNHGTGGASLNATLHDAPGVNDALYTPTTFGQGLDVRGNLPSTPSEEPAVSGDYLSVDYTLTDSGTIATEMTINQLYDFQTMWGNSSHGNDWEAWIYANGHFAARADRGTTRLEYDVYLFGAEQLDPHHYAYTWERDGDQVQGKIYIDGEFQGQVVGNWRDPGSTVFIAGGTGNHLGAGIYDEFRIYSTALSEAEILYLSQNAPETELPSGDYNMDGKVDAADYVFWRDFIGTTEGYTAWKDNFGGPSGNGTAANVPEPSTLALGLFVALVGSFLLRKQR